MAYLEISFAILSMAEILRAKLKHKNPPNKQIKKTMEIIITWN